MKWWQKLSLVLIFILALVVRLWNTGSHPAFISDEASIGYNAYSILKTGKDEWGKFLPLTFKSFGEYKLPVYIYTTVSSIAVFGLNEFATRLPSALFGSLTVLLMFFLIKEILSKTKSSIINHQSSISLLASFLLAISPWHIQVSRMALEANLGLFITVLGVLLLFKARENVKLYYPSFFFFILSFYTYNSCRVFAPFFLLIYFLIERRTVEFKNIIKPVIFALILLLPLFFSGFIGSRERFYKVGIFSDPGIIAQINEQRGECQTKISKPFCVLRYNRPVVYTQVFIKNYLSHFSWKFLFTQSSGLAQYSAPGQGELYFWELPFLVIGLIYLLQLRQGLLVLLSWILIAPLANSLTGTAHPVRAILILPIFQIFSAVGLTGAVVFFKQRKYFKYIFSILLSFVILVSFLGFLIRYFLYYPIPSDWNWQMGYKELYQKLALLEPKSDKIYVSKFYGEPHIFYLFYRKYNPLGYQKEEEVIRYDRKDLWVNVDRIGKYYFVQEPKEVFLKDNDLLAVPLQKFAFEGKILGDIKYNDGKIAFLILGK